MSSALDKAIEISHYAGELYSKVTDPTISRGKLNFDFGKVSIAKYVDPLHHIKADDVPKKLCTLFKAAISYIGSNPEVNLDARATLQGSLKTLEKALNWDNPEVAKHSSYKSLQLSLFKKMSNIMDAANEMKLIHP